MVAARTNFLAAAGAATVVCLLGIATALPPANNRILEGDESNSGDYPWVVSLRVDNTHTCMGSIISSQHILSAAHSFSALGTQTIDLGRVTARIGSINQYAGGQIVSVKAISVHPSYANFLHDISVITLAQPLTFSAKVAKIVLATPDDDAALLEEGAAATVSGWGLQLSGATPYKLQSTSLKILSPWDCEYEAGYGYQSVVCLSHAEHQGICRGDDGASVVHDNKLVGVISFAFGNCGTKYPDIAGKVSYYHDWIHQIIAA